MMLTFRVTDKMFVLSLVLFIGDETVIVGFEGADISPLYTEELTGFAIAGLMNRVPTTAEHRSAKVNVIANAFIFISTKSL